MTIKQKILSSVYPFYQKLIGLTGIHSKFQSNSVTPPADFYALQSTLNNGAVFSFEQLRGKKVVIVNTASDCIYTSQYKSLENFYTENKNEVIVLGFPSNEFKQQENKNDVEIAAFCKLNFGVSFPLMKKSFLLKSSHQHEVYEWLTDKTKNGWNDTMPVWNFCKYVINEEGRLTHFFESAIEPSHPQFLKAFSD